MVMAAVMACLGPRGGRTEGSPVQGGVAVLALLLMGCMDRVSQRAFQTFLTPRPDALLFRVLMLLRCALPLALIPLLQKNRKSGVRLAATGAVGLLVYLILDYSPLSKLARGAGLNAWKLIYTTLTTNVGVLAAFLFGGLWCALPWRVKKRVDP